MDPDEAVDGLFGLAEQPIGMLDRSAFARTLSGAAVAAARNPVRLAGAGFEYTRGAVAASHATLARLAGRPADTPIPPSPRDARFRDGAWRDNPWFFALQQFYFLNSRLVDRVVDAAELPADADRKTRFMTRLLTDALAPTNTLLGNPTALRRARDTGGRSVARGLRNLMRDLRHNGGWPSKVDVSEFEVGRNVAVTPGNVVYRSELIELLEYAPQTPSVHAVPLLFCPPWINKYYIVDLAPGRSLVEWAVQHGHRTFVISYRNPDASMADTTLDDYLLGGPLDAIRVVRAITGAPKVNTVSVCLGGTLTAMAMAYGAAIGDEPIHTTTFLNTHTDFSDPGVLGAFTDDDAITALERRMAKKGYLDAADMAHTFDAIRANDLVFNYVVSNWLLGETPPAFDLLAWNADSTRMPAAMHSQYLRSCYLRNEFARGELAVAGVRVDPAAMRQSTYVLAAVDDHIVPWKSGYKTTHLLGGRSRFVLSSAGHVAGIVNPPGPKATHWTGATGRLPADPAAWLATAELHEETWWEDWARWIAPRAGRMVRAPAAPGSAEFPVLDPAPGAYVHART